MGTCRLMSSSDSFWNSQRSWLAGVAFFAAAAGLSLVAGLRTLDPRWLVCIMMGVMVLWAGIMSRQFERFMLMLLFLVIPANIDINFDLGGASLTELSLPSGTPRLGISVMDMILIILYPIWIARMMVHPHSRKIVWPAGATFFCGFILWGVLSLLHAENIDLGVALIIGYLRAFMLFFYLANNIKSREDLWMAGWCLAAGLALEGLLCLGQKAAGGNLGLGFLGERNEEKEMAMGADRIFRVGGTQGHPNALGGYLCSVLPVAMALCLAPISKFKRLMMAGSFCLGLLALILSFSRSAWMSGFLSCVLLAGWVLFSQRKKLLQLLPALIAGGFMMLLLGIAFGPYIKNRMEQDDKGSALSRIPQWQMAFSMVKAEPWLGVGINNYNMVMQRHETYVEDPTSHGRVFLYQGRPHNVFIGIAAEVGIPGLLWLVAFTLAVTRVGIRQIFKSKDELTRLILAGMLLGFLGRIPHDAFHTGNLASHIFFWIYPACLVSVKKESVS